MSRGAKTLTQYTHVVGVDEVGRGPLAGPVAVCAVMAEQSLDLSERFPGLNDSKKMTAAARERVYALAGEAQDAGDIRFVVSYSSHRSIDGTGITRAIDQALQSALKKLDPPLAETYVYLDGLLHAPPEYSQETVIHGDSLILAISLASVIAKVSRDALMDELALDYPQYGFARNKGYGTRAHYAALATHGPTPIHRTSFLPH